MSSVLMLVNSVFYLVIILGYTKESATSVLLTARIGWKSYSI